MNRPRTLDIASAGKIRDHLAAHPPVVSEQTFTNLFAWRQTRPVWYLETGRSLLFLVRTDICVGDQMIVMGPPVGPESLAELLGGSGLEWLIGAIRVTAADLEGLPPSFTAAADRDNSDYVYRVADLASLTGRKYSKKRSHVKQCLKSHSCSFEKIDDGNIDECRELLDRWCQDRHCDLNPGLCGESRAINTTIDLFGDLGLLGGLIRVDGRVQAFSIAERLNGSTAVWHFEKAAAGINGLGQLINQWFARECLQDFEFVNREQDLGIPGLRQAKESYYPDHMVEKFTVFRE